MGLKFGFSENIGTELNQVHQVMIAAYDSSFYAVDSARAREMERILRAIKKTNISLGGNNLESGFDRMCYDIAEKSLRTLQLAPGSNVLSAKYLFMNAHQRSREFSQGLGVDDIVEAELSTVLQSIQSLGTGDKDYKIDISGYTTGREKGNLEGSAQKLMENVTEGAMKSVLDRLQNTNFKKKAYKNLSAKIKDTEAKSIKTDVISFGAEVTANLKPEWEQFSVFQDARFTVKNYIFNKDSKKADANAIRVNFGATNPYKSVMAQLGYLGFSTEQSKHIFFHSINSWLKSSSKAVEIHIPHLRFAYELQGSGLYDTDGMSISGADFLIINNPTDYEGIYVRSTKELIAKTLRSEIQSAEPFTSGSTILYSDIIKGNI